MITQPRIRLDSIREKLSADHVRLEGLFEDTLRRFALDDPDETRAAWGAFERGLATHLDAEEKLILPAFACAHPVEAAAIGGEHDKIRARLLELGIAVDLHTVRMTAARAFVRELGEHAYREDALMYRWAEKNLEETFCAVLVRGMGIRV